ncbi:MAG TPA: pilin [Candidatus Saccharimonadales bacterium]|nr:pilin [Candidatus Saccharimonadales bacterium]
MLKRFKFLLALLPLLCLTVSLIAPHAAHAVCDMDYMSITTGAQCAQGNEQPSDLFGNGGIFRQITNILLFLVGAIAVIMLIVGGIRYIVSAGDQTQVTAAKNTILYAIVGIVVAFLAYAAVNFVTQQLVQNT